MTAKKRTIYIFACVFALLLGLYLYLTVNRQATISEWLLNYIPSWKVEMEENIGIKLLRFYGADLIWMFSFTIAINMILNPQKKLVLLFCITLGVLFEIMQWMKWVNGTPDFFDVIAYSTGSAFAILFIKIIDWRVTNEKN